MASYAPIFLMTDFGTGDTYAGVMKAVCLRIEPSLQIIDLCHCIEPYNVTSAAYLLLTVVPYLPPGSIVVSVVDPGVGTQRKILGLAFDHFVLLAPDNGIGTLILERYHCHYGIAIEKDQCSEREVSATFHGRDIFAPAAALLSSGRRTLKSLGKEVELHTLVRLTLAPHIKEDGTIVASVLHRDRFGNLITNVEASKWGIESHSQSWQCFVMDYNIPIVRTYADVLDDQPLCYIGSSEFVEIGVRKGSAVARFGRSPQIIFSPR